MKTLTNKIAARGTSQFPPAPNRLVIKRVIPVVSTPWRERLANIEKEQDAVRPGGVDKFRGDEDFS
jgi:hypothetical protein